jgi:polyphosphate:AMP phosphotransferase
MFEAAELGQTVPKKEYKERLAALREQLLEAQAQLMEADFPVLLLFGGVDGAGKGESTNLLSEWLDPHFIVTRAYDAASQSERERPDYWRYWRDLPPKGHIGIFLSAWYHRPLLQHVHGEITDAEFHDQLDKIVAFERTLADDGALILKFWMHLGRDAQRARFENLEADPLQRWRVTNKDWNHWRMYDRFVGTAEAIIRRTSMAEAPWAIVEGYDFRYYGLKVGTLLLEALQHHLAERRKRAAVRAEPVKPHTPVTSITGAEDGNTILSGLDMTKSLGKKKYRRKLEKWQGLLNLLHRRARDQGMPTVLVFQGWDAAGKGGAIRRITRALDARAYEVIPVGAPTDEEKAQHYLWRFWRQLPRAGRVTIFDRSWYGRVLVERIEGFATEAEWRRAYEEINEFEQELVEGGVALAKFWIHITKDEQEQRFRDREQTAYKRWKMTHEDWRNRERWEQYEIAVHDMIERTGTQIAPWVVVEGNDKRYARVKVLRTVCKTMQHRLGEHRMRTVEGLAR